MLDVHAPHGSGHSWKDFLFHMAAIACGLLLALALEKVATYVHERHLLADSRRELAAELEDNREVWQDNTSEASRIKAVLEANVKIIRALRSSGAPGETLDYSVRMRASRDGAWQSAQQNGSLSLMPHDELTNQAWFYRMLRDQLDSKISLISAMKIAAAYAAAAPPDKLDPQELEALERSTIEAQGRLDVVTMFLAIEDSGLKRLAKFTNGAKPR
jgi:hypothetical protein